MPLYVYIITHPKFENWIKVGRTTNLTKRLDGYNVGCPKREYKYEYIKELSNEQVYSIEQHFKINVNNNGYEWFNCTVSDGITLINDVLNQNIIYKKFLDRHNEKVKFQNKKGGNDVPPSEIG